MRVRSKIGLVLLAFFIGIAFIFIPGGSSTGKQAQSGIRTLAFHEDITPDSESYYVPIAGESYQHYVERLNANIISGGGFPFYWHLRSVTPTDYVIFNPSISNFLQGWLVAVDFSIGFLLTLGVAWLIRVIFSKKGNLKVA